MASVEELTKKEVFSKRVWLCVYVNVCFFIFSSLQSNFKILLWKGNKNNLIQYPFIFDSIDHTIS